MLGTKGILMTASSDSPALNDFAKYIAKRLPSDGGGYIDCNELASFILDTILEIRRSKNHDDIPENYPYFNEYIVSGGDICRLAAQLPTIFISRSTPQYVASYSATSKLYFGSATA